MKYMIPLIAFGLLCGCGGKKEASKNESKTSSNNSSTVEEVPEDDGLPNSIAELVAEFDSKNAEAKKAFEQASSETEQHAAFQKKPKGHQYAAKVMRLLDSAGDDNEKLNALLFAAEHGRRDGVNVDALGQLMEAFPDEEKVAKVVPSLLTITDPTVVQSALNQILDKTTNKTVRGVAMFVLGSHFEKQGSQAQAATLYEKISKEYDSLEFGGSDVLASVKRKVAAMEKLLRFAVGKVAPDIEGPDIDGVSFKLSDYRGKVVMLDFWGDW